MASTFIDIKPFLASTFPFNNLSPSSLEYLSENVKFLRYRVGHLILKREAMPEFIHIIYTGQARQIGYDKATSKPVSLQLLSPGAVLGWLSHERSLACETAIASTEVVCLNLPILDFQALLKREKAFAIAFKRHVNLVEVYDLLQEEFSRNAIAPVDVPKLAREVLDTTVVETIAPGKFKSLNLQDMLPSDREMLWLVSSNSNSHLTAGSVLSLDDPQQRFHFENPVRVVGVTKALLPTQIISSPTPESEWLEDIPYAGEVNAEAPLGVKGVEFRCLRVRGDVETRHVASLQMLAEYFNLPFRREMVRQLISKQQSQTGNVSLQYCAAIAEVMGLTAQILKVPASTIGRMQPPILISWSDNFAIVYKCTPKELFIADPEKGSIRCKLNKFSSTWGNEGEVLLLQKTKNTPQKHFGVSWFVPALRQHSKVLIEVLLASIVIQIFALVNPLVTQVIIDKVLIGNSPDTLEVLGIFLLVVSVVEAILTAVRTHLFVDTTNRIDLALGSEVINHLLRLPLSYFERRPVGELATRVHELENIRQFLTGTALTVVMDALFSVVYVVVMGIYSWTLTFVALVTVPIFALLSLIVSPVVQRQLQAKAERNAETHSYLVEIMAGMQTVKAQNLEMRSRMSWQERYARYISAGFRTISTQTTASSISGFLNKLSSLLVLWVGAFLVLNHQLTLGQLIAFRILSGYVTSPLLRLVQAWQNFQETGLSLQRLSDILDTPQETESNNLNILMPNISGLVCYENISFRFRDNGPLQLSNINLNIPAGSFVGIVGQSGSGKSTLLKLLPRLYDPQGGKILIDGYDISKVELYSLRRQIGVVLQDTLLFDGSVRDNICLARKDASDDEIIAAAKIAYAHDFIMSLPNGYNTQVGERGSGLSGGQRQRVAIARTVLQNPQLLILDEATSALDSNAEAQVCRNLAEACKGKTVFFITHRLNSIRNADIILMLENGLVVEQGKHEQLMALQGYYYCLYQQQQSN